MKLICTLLIFTVFIIYPAKASETMSSPTKGAFSSDVFPALVRVTSLNGVGQGSLKDAIERKGPRLIIFDVSGVIDLKGETLVIVEPYVTIAGQAAPGNVVLIRGGIKIKAHDVHISHLAIRPGDLSRPKRSGGDLDAISVIGPKARFVLLEHLSLSWGTDENLSVSGPINDGHRGTASDVWIRNCIIAEGLNNANHKKGPHSKGALVHDLVQRVAFVGNVFISNARRNPHFKANTTGIIMNNWIINPDSAAVELSFSETEWQGNKLKPEPANVAIVNNILTSGVDTSPRLAFVSSQGSVYLKGNIIEPSYKRSSGIINWLPKPPLNIKDWRLIDTKDLKDYLYRHAGSRPSARDIVDIRIMQQIKSQGTRIIDSQSDVGGYPPIDERRYLTTLPPMKQNWLEWLQLRSNALVLK